MKSIQKYTNPILSGFYPDPSVCRVGEDFYLVNSTFNYYPGIPVMHSCDLVHWTQIGNVIHRPEQLEWKGIKHSMGIFAPTIRYHSGTFFVVCTHVTGKGNFLVTADNPSGPWSDPYWLAAEGIDPSLFFDDADRCWYCGTKDMPNRKYYGDNQIFIQELDLDRKQLVGESKLIWHAHQRDAVWPEGPHIYKVGSWYYLLYAEGGTGLDHAVFMARSRTIEGPWEGKKSNPVLSHRDLGKNTPVINVGHADLIDDPNGNWWMVLLASRPYGDQGSYNLGRETFLVPVRWEDEWPWPSPESGRVEREFDFPCLDEASVLPEPSFDLFEEPVLPINWMTLQSDKSLTHCFDRPGYFRLGLNDPGLRHNGVAGFAGRRQRHMSWYFSCRMEFTPGAGESAGLALLQNHDYQYRLELSFRNNSYILKVIKAAGDDDIIVSEVELDSEILSRSSEMGSDKINLILSVKADRQKLGFYYGKSRSEQILLAADQEGDILSTTRAGGFVGTMLGVFATSEKRTSENHADFAWVEYQGKE